MNTEMTRRAVTTYFEAWRERDFERLRTVLAPGVTFAGPLGTADAITWFDLVTDVADPVPTANWSHVEDGVITTIRVAFDPRRLVG